MQFSNILLFVEKMMFEKVNFKIECLVQITFCMIKYICLVGRLVLIPFSKFHYKTINNLFLSLKLLTLAKNTKTSFSLHS